MVISNCKRCHSPIAMGTDSGLCESCASREAEEMVQRAQRQHLHDLTQLYGGAPVFCLIVDPKGTQTGRQLRGFRDRNRLYCRGANGMMYRVPGGWGSSQMVRSMRNRRLYLLTNGMY